MTLEDLEKAYLQVVELSEALLKFPNSERADALYRKCRFYAAIRGRYGNVAEQFARVSYAAKAYKKSSIHRTKADADLHQALARVRMTIDIHQRSAASDLDLTEN